MSPETIARVDQAHRQDMITAAARAHLVAGVSRTTVAAPATSRPAARAQSILRHALAAIAVAARGLATP